MNDNEVTDVEVIEKSPETPDLGRLLNPARFPDEKFEDYKVRRKSANKVVKNHIRNGTMFHNSRPDPDKKGVTYRKPKVVA
jgi:hypothetical protein